MGAIHKNDRTIFYEASRGDGTISGIVNGRMRSPRARAAAYGLLIAGRGILSERGGGQSEPGKKKNDKAMQQPAHSS
jgi:hypothetical protein